MHKPKYVVRAGSYEGTFDLSLDKIIGFLTRFAPDPFWQAKTYQIIEIASGEVVHSGQVKGGNCEHERDQPTS